MTLHRLRQPAQLVRPDRPDQMGQLDRLGLLDQLDLQVLVDQLDLLDRLARGDCVITTVLDITPAHNQYRTNIL